MKGKQNKVLSCKDYTVTNERFDLILDKKLEMLVTSPKPNTEAGRHFRHRYINHFCRFCFA